MKKKWYLRPMVIIILSIVTPPIGYINLFLNKKNIDSKEWLGYLAISTIFTALWVTKFLPHDLRIPAIICVALLGTFLLTKKE
ncbi:hypothetical protein [Paenibacillus wulumuqiensis]|uniref:hypothetical protein n=1 Tax=Paenibacillus wulumuqiensis TaxID=1567107 RepID=UPI00061A0281|nr:hypothetical protein [Paenibacillus wulumuqiensis]